VQKPFHTLSLDRSLALPIVPGGWREAAARGGLRGAAGVVTAAAGLRRQLAPRLGRCAPAHRGGAPLTAAEPKDPPTLQTPPELRTSRHMSSSHALAPFLGWLLEEC
jgi:hypothetical protein